MPSESEMTMLPQTRISVTARGVAEVFIGRE